MTLIALRLLSNVKIPELSKPSVHMKDPEKVQQILESMSTAGSNTVQVTLTLNSGLIDSSETDR